MTKIVVDNVTWLDCLNPDYRAIETIRKIHDFHPLILNELTRPSAFSKAEVYDGYIFFTFHLPVYSKKTKTCVKADIDFLITRDHVITAHHQELEPFAEFTARLKHDSSLRSRAGEHAGAFICHLFEECNQFRLRQLTHIEKDLERINKDIFTNQEHHILQEIAYAKRNILNYYLITKPQELFFRSLEETGAAFWGPAMKMPFRGLNADDLKVIRQIESYRDTIESLEATNSQLLNAKTAAIMQRFTMLAFLTFPLALFTGLYNVPAVATMLNAVFGGFWYSFAAAVIVTIATFAVFSNKNWF